MASGRIRCLMLGVGGPTFIIDWARAVSTFADVVGVRSVRRLPAEVPSIARGLAETSIEGFTVLLVRQVKLRPSRLMWRLNARLESNRLLRAIRYIQEKHGPVDILHTHFYAAAAAGPAVATRLGIPWVHTEHSSNLAVPDPDELVSRSGRAILRRVIGQATCVMLVGPEQADGLRRLGMSGNWIVVGNPVDATAFQVDDDRPRSGRLVSVGGLVPRKRHDLLIRAFASVRLRGDLSHLKLDLVGDGPEESNLRRLAETLGVAESIEFHGRLSRSRVGRVMAQADLYVHCAAWESFGVTIVEALLAGVPVVATKSGGVTSLLPSTVAVVSEEATPEGLAEVIASSLGRGFAEPSAIANWAESHFGLEVVARRIEDVYMKALGNPGEPLALP